MKFLGKIDNSKSVVTKEYVDALTDTFVKSFTEPFANDDYIASSSNVTLENGYIRANRQYQVNQNIFSDSNGTKDGSVTYDANRLTNTSVVNSQGTYTTNWHTGLTSTNSICLASDFNHYNADSIQNEVQITPSSGTLESDVINYKQIVDINNRVWHFYQVRSTGSVYVWVTDLSNNNVISHQILSNGVAAISTAPAVPAYRTLNAVSSDDGNVYVSFWTGGSTTTGRIRTIKLRINIGSLQYGTTTNTWQSTTVAFDDYNPNISGFFCIDTFYDDVTDRLHLFYQTNNTTQGASHRIIAGTTFQSHGQTLILADSGAKQVCIAYNSTTNGRELGLFMFDVSTSANAVKARRFSLETNTYPISTLTFAFPCNGIGGAVYDTSNDRYLLYFYRNNDTVNDNSIVDVSYLPKSFSASGSIVTLSSQTRNSSNSVYKDSSFILDGGFLYFAIPLQSYGLGDSLYFNHRIFKVNPLTGALVQSFNSFSGNSLGEVTTSFVKKGSNITITGCRFTSSSANSTVIIGQTLGNDSTKIKIEIRNQTSNFITVYNNNSNWGDIVNFLSDNSLNTPVAISMGTTDTQIQVRFTLRTPNDSNIVPYVTGYKIFMNESSTNAVTGVFESKSLIDDRLVSKATLSADVTTVGLSGTITWRMSNNGGTNWVSVTPGVETNFGGVVGNNLKVEGSIAIGSGIANANSVRINSYTVTTTNVVLQSDFYNLQVNLAKMGLQVNTLSTANRLGYKNMMIDVFASDIGVEPYSIYFMYNGQSFLNFSGAELILTSVQEDTDITNVSSIVVIGDPLDISQGVTYQVRRGNGDTWVTVVPEQVHVFQSGTPTNKVQIRAIVPDGAGVRGWAYLYA